MEDKLMNFWDFMIERERIRQRRLAGQPRAVWTNDPIFAEYSFTNVKREHDRTTIKMKEIYDQHDVSHPSPSALVTAAAFRFFGKWETAHKIGWIEEYTQEFKANMLSMLAHQIAAHIKVFTGAYIIPSCGDTRDKYLVIGDILDGIWDSAQPDASAWSAALNTDSWEEMTARLKTNWGVGSFMAKEVILDYILATGWKPSDWETWTPVGPGARRGATFVDFGYLKPAMNEQDALDVICELYDQRAEKWPKGMVELDLTDIQFQLCEYAKYVRVKTGGSRPKRKFKPTIDSLTRTS